MRDIVLVPSFFRPEYLHLCLQHIRVAEGGADKEIWVVQDRKTTDSILSRELPEIRSVAASFGIGKYIERVCQPYIGNVYNFLEAYKEAYNQPDVRYIYMIEDDVLAAPDFFRWHEAVQERHDLFCSVGWHCIRNSAAQPSEDPGAYILTYQDFSSIGVCWKREKLAALVAHARPEYYRDLGSYLTKTFPQSPIPCGTWTEQAGLITRLLHETRMRQIAWPALARCFHIGIKGYHRQTGHTFTGNLQARIKALRSALETNRINNLSRDSFDDINPPRDIPVWTPESLRVAQSFPYKDGYI
jgi:hypothetical protein